ncbi:hypothetical protein AMTR_s00014p00252310 [Amborella trichopoda]|uniref:Uncharacterized protein n=1 Tax=Amborella trichopoda TaxID=13333 RepID=W1PME2_AMBTC|nr:hypothetical protein AMTR_s00014p00252310 [Amborella trichopoda]
MQSPTRSSLSQGDFLCTIIEEGDILEVEAIEEVVILEAPAPITLEAESQLATFSSARLKLMAVVALEISSLMPPAEGASTKPTILPIDPLALVPQKPAAITEVPHPI